MSARIEWRDDPKHGESKGFVGRVPVFSINNLGHPAHPQLTLNNSIAGFTESVRVESIGQGKSLAEWILDNAEGEHNR